MVSRTRSKAIKEAWKHRHPKYTCAFCHKGIFVGGLTREGRHYHNNCFDRKQIAKQFHSTAKRGFYKTHGG